VLREDLLPNATRYDLFRAAPGEADLRVMWLTWATTYTVAAATGSTIILGVLSSPTARASVFNHNLVALIIPDLVLSISCATTCFLNHANNGYVGAAMCEWQAFYAVFGVGGSIYMIALGVSRHTPSSRWRQRTRTRIRLQRAPGKLAYSRPCSLSSVASELYRLLSKTERLEDYVPPTLRTVVLKSLSMYAIVTFLASSTTWGVLPHRATPIAGMACLPLEYSHESTLFFWIAFIPLFIGIPSCYIGFVTFKVWRGGMLLPSLRRGTAVRPAGQDKASSRSSPRQARALTIYFARIVVVYLTIWIPSVFFLYVLDMHNAWLAFAGGTIAHMQGIVSGGVALSKPDVGLAVLRLFKCSSDSSDDRLGAWGFLRRIRDTNSTYRGSSSHTSPDPSKHDTSVRRKDSGASVHTQVDVNGSDSVATVLSDAVQDGAGAEPDPGCTSSSSDARSPDT